MHHFGIAFAKGLGFFILSAIIHAGISAPKQGIAEKIKNTDQYICVLPLKPGNMYFTIVGIITQQRMPVNAKNTMVVFTIADIIFLLIESTSVTIKSIFN